MEYFATRMGYIDDDFVYSQFKKHLKRLDQGRKVGPFSQNDADLILAEIAAEQQSSKFSEGQQDEEELGSTEPEAFKLREEEFSSPADYVRSFVREIRKLHHSDARNELRRRESLSYVFKTENLQPKALRKSLVAETNEILPGLAYHLTAIVPILKETYRVKLNGTKKPTYRRINTELMRDSHVLGILTASPVSEVPPVTLCEQFNDLRADEDANHVFTYVFAPMEASSGKVEIPDAQGLVDVIKEQDFERQYNAK